MAPIRRAIARTIPITMPAIAHEDKAWWLLEELLSLLLEEVEVGVEVELDTENGVGLFVEAET